MNTEIKALTGLRGFAALWVVLFHMHSADFVTAVDIGNVLGRGYLAVDAFFILSGLILAHVYGPLFDREPGWNWKAQQRFLFARFARVYPMHLCMLLLFFALIAVAALLGHQFRNTAPYTLEGAIESLFLLHGLGFSDRLVWNDPSWSVSAEVFAYVVLFWPFMLLVRRLPGAAVLLLLGLLWSGALLFAWEQPKGSLDVTYHFGVVRIVPEFLAGIFLQRVLSTRTLPAWGATVCAASGIAGIIAIAYLPLVWEALVLPLFCLLLAGLYTGSGPVKAIFANPVSVWLGRISYSVYMVHIFVRLVSGQVLKMAGIESLPTAMQRDWLIALTVASILVGAAGYALVEEPARRWLRRRFGDDAAARKPAHQPVLAPAS